LSDASARKLLGERACGFAESLEQKQVAAKAKMKFPLLPVLVLIVGPWSGARKRGPAFSRSYPGVTDGLWRSLCV
jgi:hypothetical protein